MIACKRVQLCSNQRRATAPLARPALVCRRSLIRLNASPVTESKEGQKNDPQATTEKFGLEAGLFKVLSSKDDDGKVSKTDQAKQLLAVYGSAYLLTSISLAIVSFTACYFAVDSGVDVAALLAKIGIQVNSTNETVGTFAIAYAAHKALSPVRFPPTVALTPIVAKWTGKKKDDAASN